MIERESVWSEILEFWNQLNLPYLLIGDFNEIIHISERGSNVASQKGTDDFKNFINTSHLVEIPSSNGWFTWFRGASKSKLDRLFVNPEWFTFFPNLQLSLLKRNLSDHCPLLVNSEIINWGPKPFRFQNAWLSHHGCMETIRETWGKSCNLSLHEKLSQMKEKLKQWNKNVFGHIDHNISLLEEKIQAFDWASNNRPLNESEILERKAAQQDLWLWAKRRESYWAQNSRAKWLKEGDKNTRYFHTLASIRKRKNTIFSLCINGSNISDPAGLQKEATKYFQSIFKEDYPSRPLFENLVTKSLSSQQSALLIEPFSTMEIDDAVSSCNAQKAPGPDGFNFSFIKASWETIKTDFYKMVQVFWESNTLPKGSNVAWVALIPKVESP